MCIVLNFYAIVRTVYYYIKSKLSVCLFAIYCSVLFSVIMSIAADFDRYENASRRSFGWLYSICI